MKRLVLIFIGVLVLTGCVYSRAPHGYSRYTVVTPAYPRYEPRYYTPAPPPRFRSYHEKRPHFHQHRHYW